jgi:hypothetical protein
MAIHAAGQKRVPRVDVRAELDGERPTIDGQQFPRVGLLSHSFAQASGIR